MKLRKGEWIMVGGVVVILVAAVITGIIISGQPDRLYYAYVETPQTVQGQLVFRHEGCNACHTVFGNGYAYGPTLDGVGDRRDKEWLHRYLVAPWPGVSKRKYRTEMPPYDALTQEDRDSLVIFLLALKMVN